LDRDVEGLCVKMGCPQFQKVIIITTIITTIIIIITIISIIFTI
jgi:hypothetical protein